MATVSPESSPPLGHHHLGHDRFATTLASIETRLPGLPIHSLYALLLEVAASVLLLERAQLPLAVALDPQRVHLEALVVHLLVERLQLPLERLQLPLAPRELLLNVLVVRS